MADAGSTQWLSDEEMAAWLSLIHVAMRLPARLDTQLRTESGITHYEFVVLSQLSQAPDRTLGLSALAEAANSSPSRLSHVLRKLGERGWLVRRAEGRSAYAELTDEGFAALDGAARGHVEEVRRLVFDHLSACDVAALQAALSKVTPGLAGEV
ncbi:MarR family transcriptional regulator [Tsukamurella asaccharolytica]|uniref:MarR family transcriptional regulator n=1 Tax=Tsukamurella asaccharolytica TaxID=2592067 RepID=A0A5C5R9B4_9ACTN|nr:MarR family transcriptional regulator [Tsukamurella asaccharolytica]TWS19212.1 MarR family transcriptional regulator [Tsukamurella asaccharolytica]